MATKEEFINIARACRDGAWKSEAQLEMESAKDIKGSKKSFSCFISGKSLNKGKVTSKVCPGSICQGVPLDTALLTRGKGRTCASLEFGSTDSIPHRNY